MATKKRNARSERKTIDPKVAAALANEGYEQIGGGSAHSFEEGSVLVGRFLGLESTNYEREDGELAQVAKFRTEDEGEVAYWCPTVLRNRLDEVSIGDDVRVECLGKITTKQGRRAWGFDVRVKRNSPKPEKVVRPAAPPAKRQAARKRK